MRQNFLSPRLNCDMWDVRGRRTKRPTVCIVRSWQTEIVDRRRAESERRKEAEGMERVQMRIEGHRERTEGRDMHLTRG